MSPLLRRLSGTRRRSRADLERALEVAETDRDIAWAEKASAYEALGKVAAAAGRPGAPGRWNVEDLVQWVTTSCSIEDQRDTLGAELDAVDEALAKAGATVERIPDGRYEAIASLAARDASDLATAVHGLTERSYGRGEDGVPPMSRSEVLTELGDAPGAPEARGMVVDGDVLAAVIRDHVPRSITDDAAKRFATSVLDRLVLDGMTVLQGPDLTRRPMREVDGLETGGGPVCGACGTPYPCPEHQPDALAAQRAEVGWVPADDASFRLHYSWCGRKSGHKGECTPLCSADLDGARCARPAWHTEPCRPSPFPSGSELDTVEGARRWLITHSGLTAAQTFAMPSDALLRRVRVREDLMLGDLDDLARVERTLTGGGAADPT